MLAAVVIIVAIGVALPTGLWFYSRWRVKRPFKDPSTRIDEIDRWLLSEFGLGYADRLAVRRAPAMTSRVTAVLQRGA